MNLESKKMRNVILKLFCCDGLFSQEPKVLKKILCVATLSITMLVAMFLFTQPAFSQDGSAAKPSGERLYRIHYNYMLTTYIYYTLTYNAKVTRTYENGAKQVFERREMMYLTFYRPSTEQNGFSDIRVTFDSLRYEYISGKDTVRWSDRSNTDTLPQHFDFAANVMPIVGRSFYLTISPYFDVAKLSDTILTEYRTEYGKIADELTRYTWLKGMADENLLFYADMNKSVLKSGQFGVDSAWKSRFTIPIEGVRYTCDTANVKFYLYDGKNFNVKAEMPKMYANTTDKMSAIGTKEERFFDIGEGSYSSGSWDIAVSPRGLIDKVIGKFKTFVNIEDGKVKWTDEIDTDMLYEYKSIMRFKD